MKAGAIDFLTKPVSNQELLDAIARAEELDSKSRKVLADLVLIEAKMATLTPRERELLSHVVAGKLNKQTAYKLGTAERTIKFHRSAILKKLGVHTVAELIRMTEKTGIST